MVGVWVWVSERGRRFNFFFFRLLYMWCGINILFCDWDDISLIGGVGRLWFEVFCLFRDKVMGV